MKVESKFLLLLGLFFGAMCAVYWTWSLENAGGVMMFCGMLLCFLPGSYYYWWSRRMKARPADDPNATTQESAGVVGEEGVEDQSEVEEVPVGVLHDEWETRLTRV